MELSERAIMALEHWALEHENKLKLEQDALERKVPLKPVHHLTAFRELLEKKLEKIADARYVYHGNPSVRVVDNNHWGVIHSYDCYDLEGGYWQFFFIDQDNQSVATRAYNALVRLGRNLSQKDIIRRLYYPELVTERDVLSLRNFGNDTLEWLQKQLVKYGFDPLPKQ